MFYGAMRQSEVVPQSQRAFDPTRHLTRRDVSVASTLRIKVKWAKNMQRYDQQRTLTMLPTGNHNTCPVMAVRAVLRATPEVPQDAPLLVIPGTTRPMTAAYLRAAWASMLKKLGITPGTFGLHSIRKAAATAAHQAGCTDLQVQRHGGWKSNAYKNYIETHDSYKVHKALIHSIQK